VNSKYLNSKWTSVKKRKGWRHYEVRNVLKKKKQLELFAVCDKKIFFLIDMQELSDRKKWIPGWIDVINEKN
tara:strand:- start:1569 stop:1784 length:216 start_codon:yes stop_codon:yes gene_type:complete